MADDERSVLAERLANVIGGLTEFKQTVNQQLILMTAEIKQSNRETMENAARDRDRWTEVLKENTREIMATVVSMQAKSDEATKERLAQYEKKITELETKGTSTREMVLKAAGGILAIIGLLALLNNFFGIKKNIEPPPADPLPPGKSMQHLPPVMDELLVPTFFIFPPQS